MSDLKSVTFAEKSALWAYYGKTEMASLCAQLLLLHNTGDKKQYMFNGPSTCQAIVTVANMLIEFGEYVRADIVLSHAKERFPNSPCNKVRLPRHTIGRSRYAQLILFLIQCVALFSDLDVERTAARIRATDETREVERGGGDSQEYLQLGSVGVQAQVQKKKKKKLQFNITASAIASLNFLVYVPICRFLD